MRLFGLLVIVLVVVSAGLVSGNYVTSGDVTVISYSSTQYNGGWRIEALLGYNGYVYNVTIVVNRVALTPLTELNITLYHNITVWHEIELNDPSAAWTIDLSTLGNGETLSIKWWEGRYNYWIPPITELLGRRSFNLNIWLGSAYNPAWTQFYKALNITFYVPLEWEEDVIDNSRLEPDYFIIDLTYRKGNWTPEYTFYAPSFTVYLDGQQYSSNLVTPRYTGSIMLVGAVGDKHNITVSVESTGQVNMTINKSVEYIFTLPPGPGQPTIAHDVYVSETTGIYYITLYCGWFNEYGLFYRWYRDTVFNVTINTTGSFIEIGYTRYNTKSVTKTFTGDGRVSFRVYSDGEITIVINSVKYNDTYTQIYKVIVNEQNQATQVTTIQDIVNETQETVHTTTKTITTAAAITIPLGVLVYLARRLLDSIE